MGKRTNIDKIKDSISCYEYAKVWGIELNGYHFKSLIDPGDSDTTASIHPTDNYWTDWKAGVHGDVIDLCMWHQFGEDSKEARSKAIKILADYTGVSFNEKRYNEGLLKLQSKIERYHNDLTDYEEDYLKGRGFSLEYIKERHIGKMPTSKDINYSNRIVIPYEDENGDFVYWISRRDPNIDENLKKYPESSEMYKRFKSTKKYMKAKINDFNQHIIWGLHTLKDKRKHDDTLILAEGIVDAMSWDYQCFHVVSACTGPFNKDQEAYFFTIAKKYKRIVLTFDNDLAGSEFTNKMMVKLFERHISFDVAVIPKRDGKDTNDYLVAHGELDSLIDSVTDGITVLVNSFDSYDDLEALLYKQARFMSAMQINSIVNKIDFERFGIRVTEKDKDRLKRNLCSKPLESTIIHELKGKHNLIYVDCDGFYLFLHGVWVRQSDNAIKRLISDCIGKEYNTNNFKNAIFNSMMSELLQPVEFNKSNVMTFLNGTLELDTGKLRGFKPSDYCTIQLNYRYDPNARNEVFEKFIEDITVSEPSRIKLLQEVGGDALNLVNTYEVGFFFCGSGANGKSIYANVLRLVYGAENISAVKLDVLGKNFHAVNLKDALVNIDEEVKFKEVRGNEKRLIELLSRDTYLEDSYKGKDRFKFRPRCTSIFFLNEMMETTDNTIALGRRLRFIKFPMRYYLEEELKQDYQLKENERIADPYLFDKIKTNPAGIFNWFYAGYKRIKEQNGFTQCIDQTELFEKWRGTNDTVLMFIEFCQEPVQLLNGVKTPEMNWSYTNERMIDLIEKEQGNFLQATDMLLDLHVVFGGVNTPNPVKIERSQMHYLYTMWCKVSNHSPMGNKKFTSKFREKSNGLISETTLRGIRYYIPKR